MPTDSFLLEAARVCETLAGTNYRDSTLSACVEFHHAHVESPFNPVHIRYLFDACDQTHDPRRVQEVGYTHLIAGAKHNAHVAEKLETVVHRDYPQQYQQALSLFQR